MSKKMSEAEKIMKALDSLALKGVHKNIITIEEAEKIRSVSERIFRDELAKEKGIDKY